MDRRGRRPRSAGRREVRRLVDAGDHGRQRQVEGGRQLGEGRGLPPMPGSPQRQDAQIGGDGQGERFELLVGSARLGGRAAQERARVAGQSRVGARWWRPAGPAGRRDGVRHVGAGGRGQEGARGSRASPWESRGSEARRRRGGAGRPGLGSRGRTQPSTGRVSGTLGPGLSEEAGFCGVRSAVSRPGPHAAGVRGPRLRNSSGGGAAQQQTQRSLSVRRRAVRREPGAEQSVVDAAVRGRLQLARAAPVAQQPRPASSPSTTASAPTTSPWPSRPGPRAAPPDLAVRRIDGPPDAAVARRAPPARPSRRSWSGVVVDRGQHVAQGDAVDLAPALHPVRGRRAAAGAAPSAGGARAPKRRQGSGHQRGCSSRSAVTRPALKQLQVGRGHWPPRPAAPGAPRDHLGAPGRRRRPEPRGVAVVGRATSRTRCGPARYVRTVKAPRGAPLRARSRSSAFGGPVGLGAPGTVSPLRRASRQVPVQIEAGSARSGRGCGCGVRRAGSAGAFPQRQRDPLPGVGPGGRGPHDQVRRRSRGRTRLLREGDGGPGLKVPVGAILGMCQRSRSGREARRSARRRVVRSGAVAVAHGAQIEVDVDPGGGAGPRPVTGPLGGRWRSRSWTVARRTGARCRHISRVGRDSVRESEAPSALTLKRGESQSARV